MSARTHTYTGKMESIIIAEKKMTNNFQCKAVRQKQNKRCNYLFMCSICSTGVIGSLCVLYIVQLIDCLFVLCTRYHWLFMYSIYIVQL